MIKKIIPAILPKDFFALQEHLERVVGVCKFVQIDICDGLYTQSKTWPFTHTPDIYFDKLVSQEDGMPFWEKIDFELDLMIKNPEEMYETFRTKAHDVSY
jgi:pentose-5-phosphate-3-epimerase